MVQYTGKYQGAIWRLASLKLVLSEPSWDIFGSIVNSWQTYSQFLEQFLNK